MIEARRQISSDKSSFFEGQVQINRPKGELQQHSLPGLSTSIDTNQGIICAFLCARERLTLWASCFSGANHLGGGEQGKVFEMRFVVIWRQAACTALLCPHPLRRAPAVNAPPF